MQSFINHHCNISFQWYLWTFQLAVYDCKTLNHAWHKNCWIGKPWVEFNKHSNIEYLTNISKREKNIARSLFIHLNEIVLTKGWENLGVSYIAKFVERGKITRFNFLSNIFTFCIFKRDEKCDVNLNSE